MPALSFATRTFVFSFAALCTAMVGSFFGISAALKERVKEGLKAALYRREAVLDNTIARNNRDLAQLIAVVSESSGLKAGMGLLTELTGSNPDLKLQIKQTLREQLRDLSTRIDYDLFSVADSQGRPVVALVVRDGESAEVSLPAGQSQISSLLEVQGKLYETTAVPVNLGVVNLGSLILGKEFNLASFADYDGAALVRDGKVVRSSLPHERVVELEPKLSAKCLAERDGCQVELQNEAYLALPVRRSDIRDGWTLITMQSLDKANSELTVGFGSVLLAIGATSVIIVSLFSGLVSRSNTRPLQDLIERLKRSEQTGEFPEDLRINSALKEVNVLSASFNRASGAIRESHESLEQAYLSFIETMAQALDARDRYTAGHSERVSQYSVAIAQAMGCSAEDVERIRIGAKLHDIGKIGIPDAVLQKSGKLTDEEYELIKTHPQIGKRILSGVAKFEDYLPVIELHHEDYDGQGYPYGLKGEEVPLSARIVHVADAYDAMTTDRAYRRKMPEERVRQILRTRSGSQFDPEVVVAFLSWVSTADRPGQGAQESAPSPRQPVTQEEILEKIAV